MILEIPSTEVEAHSESCAFMELNYKFYPTEISGIVKIKVTDKGREISPAIAYRLGRLVDQKLRCEGERILESELMQQNNVVWTVEAIDVVPWWN